MRLPLDLRDALENAAEENGKPLTKEIISRLQRSLTEDKDIQRRFGDEKSYRLMQAISLGIQEAQLHLGDIDWTKDQKTFDFVVSTVTKVIDRIRPGGSIYGHDNGEVPAPVQQMLADASLQAAHAALGPSSYLASENIVDKIWANIRGATDPMDRYARIREVLADVLNRPELVRAEFQRRCSDAEKADWDKIENLAETEASAWVRSMQKRVIAEMKADGIDTSSLER